MTIRDEQQRRAMFYRIRTRRMSFPLKGEGGRAQRNRGTLAAAGAGAGSAALLLLAMRGKPGLASLLRPSGYRVASAKVFNKGGKFLREVGGVGWVSRRPVEGAEKFWAAMPGMRKLFGSKRTIQTAGPLARGEVTARRYLKNKLADAIEGASLWRVLGGRGRTLETVQHAGDLATLRAGRLIRKARNRLVTPRVRKLANGEYERVAAPVERLVSAPFAKASRKLKAMDVMATRRMRQWVRRQKAA